ncbi:MAG: NAD(P)H-dependent oxidoreductase [Hyphomicrobiaceae bacterium]|nr:NAD(P)H-dependent oxidoreductase [Hyphomicrobiaceae bacterium]
MFIAGSARAASHNKRLARLGAAIANANDIPATFADLGDYPMPLYDGDLETAEGPPDNARKLKALMELHVGVLICCPEYNSSITPLLKNTLDWVSRVRDEGEATNHVFKTRVFALASASPGGMGGLRGLVAVRTVLEIGLGALVLPEQFALPRAADAYDDGETLKDKQAQSRFEEQIQKLARASRVLHCAE